MNAQIRHFTAEGLRSQTITVEAVAFCALSVSAGESLLFTKIGATRVTKWQDANYSRMRGIK
jgi:hypothetical protein